jgi:hypothetical protein
MVYGASPRARGMQVIAHASPPCREQEAAIAMTAPRRLPIARKRPDPTAYSHWHARPPGRPPRPHLDGDVAGGRARRARPREGVPRQRRPVWTFCASVARPPAASPREPSQKAGSATRRRRCRTFGGRDRSSPRGTGRRATWSLRRGVGGPKAPRALRMPPCGTEQRRVRRVVSSSSPPRRGGGCAGMLTGSTASQHLRSWMDRTLHAHTRRTELVRFCNDNNTTARPSNRPGVVAVHDHRSQPRRSVSK